MQVVSFVQIVQIKISITQTSSLLSEHGHILPGVSHCYPKETSFYYRAVLVFTNHKVHADNHIKIL